MTFLDNATTKVLATNVEYVAPAGQVIVCIVPLEATATVKAKSLNGDDHAVGGSYANAGFARTPGDQIWGRFSKVTVTTGIAYAYILQSVESL